MRKLLEGYLHFRAQVFPHWKDHFHLLAEGQAPKVLFITCADSRVVPSLIFQIEPGDMFLCRNAGNVVPPAGEAAGGVSATIEYAVEVLHVEHVILCGHSDCGAVRAAQRPELTGDRPPNPAREPAPGSPIDSPPDLPPDLPLVKPWLRYVQAAQLRAAGALLPSGDTPEAHFRDLVCANVLGQLDNLRTQPSVARALAAGTLQVHGWYYDILTGSVQVHNPATRSFVPLESVAADQAI